MSSGDWPPGGQPPVPAESRDRSQDPRPYQSRDPAHPPGGQPPVPPEWEEDLESEFPEGADWLDPDTEARLSEVTAYLASVPVPVLPDVIEARIGAALAAAAAGRAGTSGEAAVTSPAVNAAPGAAAPADGARPLEPVAGRMRFRRHRGGQPFRSRPLLIASSVVAACLVLAGVGYGLSRVAGDSSVSSPAAAAGSSAEVNSGPAGLAPASKPSATKATAAGPLPGAATSAAASRAAPSGARSSGAAPSRAASSGAAPPASATATVSSAPVRSPQPTAPASFPAPTAVPSPSATAGVTFGVVASGTAYQAATLAAQAQAEAAASSGMTTSAPSPALRGCVYQLTGGGSPRLVDRATYQGEAAYIIVGSAKVWVTGLGCTAGNPELIASAPLGS